MGRVWRFWGNFCIFGVCQGLFFTLSLCCVTPTVTDGPFQDSGGHSPFSWNVFPPFSPTMHYLVTEASQALLSLRWWMVLGTPQWPQWLASADKALNDFSRNLIAPQSPKDTSRLQPSLQSPPAAEIETESACLFPQDWPLTLSSSFWRKVQQRKEKNKRTVIEAIKVSRAHTDNAADGTLT